MQNPLYSIILVSLLSLSSLGLSTHVITKKHESRKLYADLQKLQNEKEALHVEWTQLLLEQGAWGTDARIERTARETLAMKQPPANTIRVVKVSLPSSGTTSE